MKKLRIGTVCSGVEKLTHFSLCSGIGGIDLAAEWAGFETIRQCEIDDYASKVLAKNFKGVKNFGDIRTITNAGLRADGIDTGGITVISAGFPCQPYSLAGKGLGDGDSRDLWSEVARVIGELKPKWFVGENTPGLFARKNQRYFHRVLQDLSSLGYSVSWGMWGAVDVGAPHKRERVFIVASKISNTACERCNSFKIFSQIAEKGLRAQGKPGVQASRSESTRVYSGDIQHQIAAECERNPQWVSSWMDRLRCLGNAVVPQQAYPIFKAIADIETEQQRIEELPLFGGKD